MSLLVSFRSRRSCLQSSSTARPFWPRGPGFALQLSSSDAFVVLFGLSLEVSTFEVVLFCLVLVSG